MAPADSTHDLAERLHSAAIRLLRRLRRGDAEAGLTGPQASALSVLVFAGPSTLAALAQAEQVRPATMSRLAAELEAAGLVTRERSAADARALTITPTFEGRRRLKQAQARRLARLTDSLARLPPADREVLARATAILARLGE
jgi:DNA-binding MarR family transcriptional regulator